jgi:hypothetical protein
LRLEPCRKEGNGLDKGRGDAVSQQPRMWKKIVKDEPIQKAVLVAEKGRKRKDTSTRHLKAFTATCSLAWAGECDRARSEH